VKGEDIKMSKTTNQMQEWAGQFGKEYTDRNALSLEEVEQLYKGYFGITRSEINNKFINQLDRNIRILEVGSNIGNQLLLLQNMGFKHLYGIELQSYAVELSKSRTKNINIIQGSALDIPFKDHFFDMVFTSGVLIHISPDDIGVVLDEMYRCTKHYIWGFEYYAEEYTKVNYREHDNLLWKTDFSKLFLERFSHCRLVRQELYQYRDSDSTDVMFLIEKDK
jgi:pseudaminic acid biosynthesis-associated methylase